MPTFKIPPGLEGRILNCNGSLLQTSTKYPLFHISLTAQLPGQDASSGLLSSHLVVTKDISMLSGARNFVSN
jgi:hypothetical protein